MSYLDKVVERRDAVKAEMDAVLEAVAAENRTDLTAEETEKVDALVEEARALDAKIEKFTSLITSNCTRLKMSMIWSFAMRPIALERSR